MAEKELSGAKRRLLDRLKRGGPRTAGELARQLGLTDVAVRQHLQSLEEVGLARQMKGPGKGRGRPSMLWSLTEVAARLFPDHHGELTVGFINAIRESFGEKGLERIVQVRAREQVKEYRKLMPAAKRSLKARIEALARQRTAEGYMAEVVQERPGCYLLVEHHCPICDAAESCLGLCSAELDVFRHTLGKGANVERTSHLLSGDQRCIYRIQKS